MTRKHYEALAQALADTRPTVSQDAFARLVQRIADVCAADNPRFNEALFIAACERRA